MVSRSGSNFCIDWRHHCPDIFDLQLRMPPPSAWGTLFLVGFFGTLAHISMTYAVRFAPSATLAPMQYVEIPLATFIGWVVFGELPNGLAAVGILITVIAGHRANRAPPLPAPTEDAPPADRSSYGN